jgi:hypothetical protein
MEDGHMNDGKELRPGEDGIVEMPGVGEHMLGGTNLPPLANGLASFPEIRDGGFVYVDKTKYIAELLRTNRRVFCARPRRFGKSLMVSTIETLYSDDPEHRAMFEGLDIFPYLSKDEWIFRPRPVIRLTMSSASLGKNYLADKNADNQEALKIFRSNLLDYVHEVASKYDISPIGKGADGAFRNLIVQLSQKKKEKVVILVDEYDFPLTTSIFRPDIQDDVREIIRDIYLQVKNAEENIFFAFFTGIAKFSNVGIFSEINNLRDISIDEKYATMFGFTESEIKKNYIGYVEDIASAKKLSQDNLIKQMKEYYDGYTFDGITHVYNPITIELFLTYGKFEKYWIETGRQVAVERFFHSREIKWEELDGKRVSRIEISSPRNIGMESDPRIVLYQTGYMTPRQIPNSDYYKLVYPNIEVKAAMAVMMLNNYFDSVEDVYETRSELTSAVEKNNYFEIVKIFNTMLSKIYKSDKKVIEGKDSKKKEDFFRNHIISLLTGADFFVHGEVPSNLGKVDIFAEYRRKALIIEVKYVDLTPKKVYKNIVSQYTIEQDCRRKLSQAVLQLYNLNYTRIALTPLPLAIVIDESREACISHAAYDKKTYRLDDIPPQPTKIGEIKYKKGKWRASYDSEITASREPLHIAEILSDGMSHGKRRKEPSSQLEAGKSEEKSSDGLSPSGYEADIDSVAAELYLCQLALPVKQYSSWRDSLKGANIETVRNNIRQLKLVLASKRHAPFWRELSHDEQLLAFQNAIHTGVSVTLRYVTPDGTFFLTAADFILGEAIGLLITFTGQAAYGPYPLSRLRENASSFWMSDKETPLEQICNDHGIKIDTPLPTPEQLLKWKTNK